MPPEIMAKLAAMKAAQTGLPLPERAGRKIGIPRK
jgi:acyl-CoA thioester hydrolase